MGILNKDSSVPLYQQLMDEIKSQINSGVLKENERILTEIELSDKYEVSRITVRKAIALLVEDEYLVKQQGIGTFVAKRKLNREINKFMGFTQSCNYAGKKASSKLLIADSIPADVGDCEKLKLSEGERVIRIKRVRYADNVPVMIEENRFPAKYSYLLAEDLKRSIYEILKEHGVLAENGVKKITICYPSPEEESLLELEPKQALLLQKDICYDKEGNPIHLCKQVVNPLRYTIEMRW